MKTLNDLSIEEKKALIGEMINKDQTGNEWSDILRSFDLDMHEDTLRKMGPGVKLAYEVLNSSGDNSYIERQKIRDLTGKVNTMYRQESRSELLREAVREAVENIDPYPSREQIRFLSKDGSRRELVVCIGDSHFGANIDCKGLYGQQINRYNEDVFMQRMGRLYEDVVKICSENGIQNVHVFMVGDLIDGILRQSQLSRLEFGLVDQVIRFSEIMCGWIDDLSQYVNVHLCGVSGNHSEIRPLGSKAREFEEQNLEKIIYWYIATRFHGVDHVMIEQECDRLKLEDVLGYHFLLLHGDGDKKIEDIARSSVNLYGKPIDFFICGHLHRLQDYPAGVTSDGNSEIIRVPSLCGMDLYAQNKGYGGKAGAVALVIQEGYGCRCKYPIKLG